MNAAERVLDILESFLKEEGEVGLVELANLSKLNISTTHRIASSLVKRGYLNQPNKRAKYSLSAKLLEFTPFIKNIVRIADVAFPFLVELNKQVNECVAVSVLDRNEVVKIEHVECRQNLRFASPLGTRLPLHCTASGKTLLAGMTEEELEKFLHSKELTRFTENTITDPNRLRAELATIRRKGIAISEEELYLGVTCVASPIKDGSGKVIAVVTASVPSSRFNSHRMSELRYLVNNCGLKISKALGYHSGAVHPPKEVRNEIVEQSYPTKI